MSEVLAAAVPAVIAAGRRRMSVRDSVMAGSRIVLGVGPVRLPSTSQLVAAFAALVRADPWRRPAWRADGIRRWIVPQEPIDESAFASLVVDASDLAPVPMDEAARLVRSRVDPRAAVSFVVTGRAIFVVVHHRLCDGLLASNLIPLLLAAADGADGPTMLSAGDTAHPLKAALRATFGRPAAVGALLSERRTAERAQRAARADVERARSAVADAGDAVVARRAAADRGSVARGPDILSAAIGPEAFRALRAWMRAQGVSLAATELLLYRRVLAAAAFAPDPAAVLVVDLRRYLPRGSRVLGNFVTGLPVAVGSSTIDRVDASVERALRAGRPLAAFATGMLRTELAPRRSPAPVASSPVHAVVSSVGRLRGLEGLPWEAPPSSRSVVAGVDIEQPGDVTFVTMIVGGALHVTAAFDSSVHDRTSLAAALALLAENPVAYLHEDASPADRGGARGA